MDKQQKTELVFVILSFLSALLATFYLLNSSTFLGTSREVTMVIFFVLTIIFAVGDRTYLNTKNKESIQSEEISKYVNGPLLILRYYSIILLIFYILGFVLLGFSHMSIG